MESPPEKMVVLNENGILEETMDIQYNQSNDQEIYFQFDLNDEPATPFWADKPMHDFDLNQSPPDEDE